MEHRSRFEQSIKSMLNNIGFIGSIICGIAYMILVLLMIIGFTGNKPITEIGLFSAINAVAGLMISWFLRIQGIKFAENIPENVEILKQYYNKPEKVKRVKSIESLNIGWFLKSGIFKVIGIILAGLGIFYIAVLGSQDYGYIIMAVINLLLFASIGFGDMAKAYDQFNQQHIPYIKLQLEIKKSQKDEKGEDNVSNDKRSG